eukprot:3003302-Pleurochrysis_carterae.AAC.4
MESEPSEPREFFTLERRTSDPSPRSRPTEAGGQLAFTVRRRAARLSEAKSGQHAVEALH